MSPVNCILFEIFVCNATETKYHISIFEADFSY